MLRSLRHDVFHTPVGRIEYQEITVPWDAIENGDYDRVVTLVESGANINAKNDDDESLLHFAAMYGNTQITRFLLSNGADIHIVDDEGKTPLH